MVEIKSISNIASMVTLLTPGLVAVYVRALFPTERTPVPTHSEAILRYFVISAVYYTLVFLVVDVDAISSRDSGLSGQLVWLVVIFLGPALLGILWGMEARKQFLGRLVGKIGASGMDTEQAATTAWDWKFRNTEDGHVLVTLKDGSQYAGLLGDRSFVSSDPDERDIYLEKVYDVNAENVWIDCGPRSVLIVANEIKSIEFLPEQRGDR